MPEQVRQSAKSQLTPRLEPYFNATKIEKSRKTNLRRFAENYNLTSISPRTMVEFSTQLYSSGHLTPEQYADLSFQAELMPNFDLTIGALTGEKAAPDLPRDYLEIWRRRLKFEKSHAANAERIIQRTQKIVELLETIESQPTNAQALTTIEQLKHIKKTGEQKSPQMPLKLPPLSLGSK